MTGLRTLQLSFNQRLRTSRGTENEGSVRLYVERPGRLRTEVRRRTLMGDILRTDVLAGRRAWHLLERDGVRSPASGGDEVWRRLAGTWARLSLGLLASLPEGLDLVVTDSGRSSAEGGVWLEVGGPGGPIGRLTFAPTGLPTRWVYREPSAGGGPVEMYLDLEEHRRVGPLLLPGRIVRHDPATGFRDEWELDDARLDAPLEAGLFDEPR